MGRAAGQGQLRQRLHGHTPAQHPPLRRRADKDDSVETSVWRWPLRLPAVPNTLLVVWPNQALCACRAALVAWLPGCQEEGPAACPTVHPAPVPAAWVQGQGGPAMRTARACRRRTGTHLVQAQQQDVVPQPLLHQLLEQLPPLGADGGPAAAVLPALLLACAGGPSRRGK